MIEETGTVVELKSKQIAVVLCKKSSSCKNCASMESCQMGDDNRSKLVETFNQFGAQVGDEVVIATSTKSFLQSSAILYVFPLIALLIGAIIGQVVGDSLESGPDPNLLSALTGIGFLIGSFLLVKAGSRSLSAEKFMPKIIRINPTEKSELRDHNYGN